MLTTRRVEKDGSEYFGPFTNYKTVRTIMDVFSNLYSLRTCHYDLRQKNIIENKYFILCFDLALINDIIITIIFTLTRMIEDTKK